MTTPGRYYIYTLRHSTSGRCYVGLSRRPEERRREHLDTLRKGWHSNTWLQEAWDEAGADAFSFKVVEELSSAAEAEAAEHRWITRLEGECGVYNVRGTRTRKRRHRRIRRQP